jgi:hypothetical protein
MNVYDNYEKEMYFTNDITFLDLYNIQNIESINDIRKQLKEIEAKKNKTIATVDKINEIKNKLSIAEKNSKKHFIINKNT